MSNLIFSLRENRITGEKNPVFPASRVAQCTWKFLALFHRRRLSLRDHVRNIFLAWVFTLPTAMMIFGTVLRILDGYPDQRRAALAAPHMEIFGPRSLVPYTPPPTLSVPRSN